MSTFREKVAKLKGRKGVYNPEGLAAYISRMKHGKKKFQAMAKAGLKRKGRK